MANQETNPDSLAKKAFLVTMLGAIIYVGVVFMFVIGGNQREEAAGTAPRSEDGASQHSETFKP